MSARARGLNSSTHSLPPRLRSTFLHARFLLRKWIWPGLQAKTLFSPSRKKLLAASPEAHLLMPPQWTSGQCSGESVSLGATETSQNRSLPHLSLTCSLTHSSRNKEIRQITERKRERERERAHTTSSIALGLWLGWLAHSTDRTPKLARGERTNGSRAINRIEGGREGRKEGGRREVPKLKSPCSRGGLSLPRSSQMSVCSSLPADAAPRGCSWIVSLSLSLSIYLVCIGSN